MRKKKFTYAKIGKIYNCSRQAIHQYVSGKFKIKNKLTDLTYKTGIIYNVLFRKETLNKIRKYANKNNIFIYEAINILLEKQLNDK